MKKYAALVQNASQQISKVPTALEQGENPDSSKQSTAASAPISMDPSQRTALKFSFGAVSSSSKAGTMSATGSKIGVGGSFSLGRVGQPKAPGLLPSSGAQRPMIALNKPNLLSQKPLAKPQKLAPSLSMFGADSDEEEG